MNGGTTGSGWWRRRRLALIAFAILLPIAVVVSLFIEVPNYLSSHPTQPREVARGTTTRYADLDLRLESRTVVRADSARGRELEVPTGTELVIVTLRVDPTAAPKRASLCTVSLVQTTGTGDRVWNLGYSSPGAYEVPEADEPGCSATRGQPYTMQSAVLLPSGAAAHAVVRVSVSSALPAAVLLR